MNEKPSIKIVQHEHGNICIEMFIGGAWGIFRIAYLDVSRKNARYKSYEVKEAYLEHDLKPVTYLSQSSNIAAMVDLCLFVERKKDWILNQALTLDS